MFSKRVGNGKFRVTNSVLLGVCGMQNSFFFVVVVVSVLLGVWGCRTNIFFVVVIFMLSTVSDKRLNVIKHNLIFVNKFIIKKTNEKFAKKSISLKNAKLCQEKNWITFFPCNLVLCHPISKCANIIKLGFYIL